MMKLVRHAEEPFMPEKREALSEGQIADVAKWIDLGAPYDKPLVNKGATVARGHPVVTAEDRQYWAFRPLANVAPPGVKDQAWGKTAVDRFILAGCEAKGIHPNAVAEKRKLIRRAYLDLVGLPPSPGEVEAFLADPSPHAYENLVDRLLNNPHLGERWARHWLDVARFAESNGYEQDYDRPHAYVYRDFVIKAINDDLPFDTFVRWQLAGDELQPLNQDALAATGFIGAGTHATQITANQAEKERYDELDDMANTTGVAFLGLTVGCARCHDHKYDPIPQKDYYRLIANFTTTVRGTIVYDTARHKVIPQATTKPGGKYPATQPGGVYMMVCSEGIPATRLHTQGPDFYPVTYNCKRGDVNQKDGEAKAGYLSVLENGSESDWHVASVPAESKLSFRRTGLANWLTDTQRGAGQLVARVIVNRLWQHHFGRGLVATPNDFGAQGEKPSHPELLDYLASELIRNGWHLKPIHRLIMTSAVYMQGNEYDEARNKLDPDDVLCWRRPLLRLEAEAIRDSMLSVSGMLDEKLYGPGTLDEAMPRRSVYFFVKRSHIISSMLLFDAPNALTSMGTRATTTVAPQALAMMNDPAVRTWSANLAKRVAGEKEPIRRAFNLALCREPSGEEAGELTAFLNEQTRAYGGAKDAKGKALEDVCQAILSLNEFLYVE